MNVVLEITDISSKNTNVASRVVGIHVVWMYM